MSKDTYDVVVEATGRDDANYIKDLFYHNFSSHYWFINVIVCPHQGEFIVTAEIKGESLEDATNTLLRAILWQWTKTGMGLEYITPLTMEIE